jgi:hypothetical protein
VSTFAEAEHIPVVRFGKTDRKIDVMRRHVAAQATTGRSGVPAIGVAQEYQNVFTATARGGRATGRGYYALPPSWRFARNSWTGSWTGRVVDRVRCGRPVR